MKSTGLLLFFIFLSAHSHAQLGSIKLGARYSSLSENRGVILYNDFQIAPVIAIYAFNNRFEFLGSSINYRDYIYSDVIRLRTKIHAISDNPLFPKHESIQSIYPDREDSYEWTNRIEMFLPGYQNYGAEIDLGYSLDLKAHHGGYTELQIKTKLADYMIESPKKINIEPNLFLSAGSGDQRHNEYFYGAVNSSSTELNNFAYGLWINFPNLADRNNPIILIKHFEVLGKENQQGAFARDRDHGWMLSFVGTVNVL